LPWLIAILAALGIGCSSETDSAATQRAALTQGLPPGPLVVSGPRPSPAIAGSSDASHPSPLTAPEALLAAGLSASEGACGTSSGLTTCSLESQGATVFIQSASFVAQPGAEHECETLAGAGAPVVLGFRYVLWAGDDGVYIASRSRCTLTRVVDSGDYDPARSLAIAMDMVERAVRL
jgi:hypothetical protein